MNWQHTIRQISFRNVGPFTELVKVPLSRLNLFFGPNSAGKSTVERGLQVMNNYCAAGSYGPDGHRWQRLEVLKPIWRRKDSRAESFVNSMSLGVTLQPSSSKEKSSVLDTIGGAARSLGNLLNASKNEASAPKYLELPKIQDFTLKFTFHLYMELESGSLPIEDYSKSSHQEDGFFHVTRDFEIEVNNDWLIRHDSTNGTLKLNCQHKSFLDMVEWSPALAHPGTQEAIAEAVTPDGLIEFGDENHFIILGHDGKLDFIESQLGNENTDDSLEATTYGLMATIIEHLIHPLYVDIKQAIESATKFSSVSGNRTIPSNRDLAIYVNNTEFDTKRLDDLGFVEEFMRDLNPTTNSEHYYLQLLADDFTDSDFRPQANSYTGRLNKALLEHFFTETGYFIAAKVFSFRSEPDDIVVAHLVRLHLSDANGLTLNIKDVGSGVGYLLPVIVGLNHFANTFIHQPELHLHPALQGGIADTAIGILNNTEVNHLRSKQIILETHSEHVILRFLKRIRQTTAGRRDELSIHPQDLNVLYFDPRIKGGPRVLKLRISESGEFLDPWPRGFFEERDQDIFDE